MWSLVMQTNSVPEKCHLMMLSSCALLFDPLVGIPCHYILTKFFASRTPSFADQLIEAENGLGEVMQPPEKSFWAKYVSTCSSYIFFMLSSVVYSSVYLITCLTPSVICVLINYSLVFLRWK